MLRSTLTELGERAQKLVGISENGRANGHKPPLVPSAQMDRLKQAVEQSSCLITRMMDKVSQGGFFFWSSGGRKSRYSSLYSNPKIHK
jgi:hypothetical protein